MTPLVKTILLAEDSVDDERLFLRSLKQAGMENPVFVVRDGEEAIAYLKGEGGFANRLAFPLPCALFLDLKMRRVGGLEVLRWIKTQENLKDLPVVVLSGYNEPKAISEAYQLGAQSFLTKPLAHRDVNNLLNHFRTTLTVAMVMAALADLVNRM